MSIALAVAWPDRRLVPATLRRIGDALRRQLAGDTATVLELAGRDQLLADEPWISESLRLRNIYTEPLNMLQAELLQRNREAPEPVLAPTPPSPPETPPTPETPPPGTRWIVRPVAPRAAVSPEAAERARSARAARAPRAPQATKRPSGAQLAPRMTVARARTTGVPPRTSMTLRPSSSASQ